MKAFRFECTACGKPYAIRRPAEQVGRQMKCSRCSAVVTISAPEAGTRVAPIDEDGAIPFAEAVGAGRAAAAAAARAEAEAVARTWPMLCKPLLRSPAAALGMIDRRQAMANLTAVSEGLPAPSPVAPLAESAPPADAAHATAPSPAATFGAPAAPSVEDLIAQMLAEAEPLPAAGRSTTAPTPTPIPVAPTGRPSVRPSIPVVPVVHPGGRHGNGFQSGPRPAGALRATGGTMLLRMDELAPDDVDLGETMIADPISPAELHTLVGSR